MRQKFRLVTLIMAIVFIYGVAFGQKTMDVSSFKLNETDLMARVTKPVRDNDEGKLCALIKVYSPFGNIEARPDALGIVKSERHGNELWYYVPYGAKSVAFSAPGYFPLVYQYPESIKDGSVYELYIKHASVDKEGMAENTNMQLFTLSCKPDDVRIYIDGVEQESEYGVYAAIMNKGEHEYRVEANQYSTYEGEFELGDSPVRESVTLTPLFGSYEILSLPENGFNVLLNGRKIGETPYKSGRVAPGSYRLKIEKDKYYSKDTLVRIKAGDDVRITCKLTSHADSLFFNRRMGGRKLSFGIKAGYVMPMVYSKASGDFVGSMINYGYGNSRENAKYTSQFGFTAGLILDLRLVKNLYLTSGVDYKYIEYKNDFSLSRVNQLINSDGYRAFVGNQDASFSEKYNTQLVEIPLVLSYRFILSRHSSIHVNCGGFVNYAVSSKMKLNGSSSESGVMYKTSYGNIDYNSPMGTFGTNSRYKADFDLLSKNQRLEKIIDNGASIGASQNSDYVFNSSPFNALNGGLRFGLTYELSGFQLGVNYDLQLTNQANSAFWESSRIPVLNNQIGENNMSGYKHKVNCLSVTFGYLFRY